MVAPSTAPLRRWQAKILVPILAVLLMPGLALAATEEEKQAAIDAGLVYLATTQSTSGSNGYWSYASDGTVAATASAALAFIEEGYRPGTDVVIGGTNYGDVVGKAVNYIMGSASVDTHSGTDGIYFSAGSTTVAYNRSVYTTGIVAPVIYALGEAYGENSTVGYGSAAISGSTYKEAMQDVMDWFTAGQNTDGGWRYYPNYSGSDNSTAQWGALPYLYGESWGLATPASVQTGLESWTNTVQNTAGTPGGQAYEVGGSGYADKTTYVNMAKTGGMLLEFAVLDKSLADADVQAALAYMTSMTTYDHWNQGPTTAYDQWLGGHLNNPYAMWAVYKGLQQYGLMYENADGILVGQGISSAAGGITIGFDADTSTSAAGDWYSQYCDLLVNLQNTNGSWSGYQYWTGALATGWYINILNATGAPGPAIPEPTTLTLFALGAGGLALVRRRKRR